MLKRIKLWLKGLLNGFLKKTEDKDFLLDEIIRQYVEKSENVKHSIAKLMAKERILEDKNVSIKNNIKQYEEDCKSALKQEKEDLARIILEKKTQLKKEIEQNEKTIQFLNQNCSQLKKQLEQLNRKIDEAKHNKEVLKAKKSMADAQNEINGIMKSMNDGYNFDDLNRISTEIEEDFQTSNVELELNNQSVDKQIEELREENNSKSIDLELERMKEEIKVIENEK